MAAPKNNLFALGHHYGRPKQYPTALELHNECAAYFDWCVEAKEVITITGLCIYLEISRTTLMRWKNGDIDNETDIFSNVITRAIAIVENAYEKKLDTFTFGGAIFALKNINKEYWKDKIEAEVNQTNTNVTAAFGSSVQSPSESADDSRIDS
jgi:hypothetical protein